MEKFAIDLDKVLDEFEFNEDRAEQTSNVVEPTTTLRTYNNSLLNDRGVVRSVAEPVSRTTSSVATASSAGSRADDEDDEDESEEEGEEPELAVGEEKRAVGEEKFVVGEEKRAVGEAERVVGEGPVVGEGRVVGRRNDEDSIVERIDLRKDRAIASGPDSVNRFAQGSRASDRKFRPKPAIGGEPEPVVVGLTIFNNIAQSLAQKQPNETANKIQNSYDKRLNQASARPSVSNVFSSLNEYINAPTVNFDVAGDGVVEDDDVVDEARIASGGDRDSPKDRNVLKVKVPSENDCNAVKVTAKDMSTNDCNLVKVTAKDVSVNDCNLSKDPAGNDYNLAKVTAKDAFANDCNLAKVTTKDASVNDCNLSKDVFVNDCNLSKDVSVNDCNLSKATAKDAAGNDYNSSKATIKDSSLNDYNSPKATIKDSSLNDSNQARTSVESRPESRRKSPPRYQNILIPVKFESTSSCEEVEARVARQESSSRVYENVNATRVKPEETSESRHTYENVDFEESSSKARGEEEEEEEESSYDRVYVGRRERTGSEPDEAGARRGVPTAERNTAAEQDRSQHRPIGFSKIDDLSEDELNKYLAELEAEENAKDSQKAMGARTFQKPVDDEDANEAPIFESVMIGELPSVSKEELKEKAKKFPVIDYGVGSSGGSVGKDSTSDFLEKQPWDESEGPAETTSASRESETSERRSSVLASNAGDVQLELNASKVEEENDLPRLNATEMKSDAIRDRVEEFPEEKRAEEESLTEKLLSQDSETSQKSVENPEVDDQRDAKGSESGTLSLAGDNDGDNETKPSPDCENATSTASEESNSHDDAANPESTEESEASRTTTTTRARPQTLDIVTATGANESSATGSPCATSGGIREQTTTESAEDNSRGPSPEMSDNSSMDSTTYLGKQPPFWVPDNEAPNCMLCEAKFTVLKRRHHCRACGKVLCNKCCSMKFRLEYQGNIDSRVCRPCYQLLVKAESNQGMSDWSPGYRNCASNSDGNASQGRQPNPNNPMEYCSTVPPLQQLAGGLPSPPTVMVPVGVLKREGSAKQRSDGSKSVMFSDGIRPGCDLTELDTSWDLKPPASSYRKPGSKRVVATTAPSSVGAVRRQNLPPLDPATSSYIPQDPSLLPPTVTMHKGQIAYHDVVDQNVLYKTLKNECEPPVMFAINRNLYAYVKIINLNCCVNRICWNVTSKGLVCVGQDEVILLVETLPDETRIPKDLLVYINHIYMEALKGNMITELGVSIYPRGNLLGSREHAGFLFIRQTLQCLQKIVLPPAPFLVGILVHRWETPWAKVFPLRLVLRLGAEYRYYPCPLVSVRFRDAVYFEIGHTVMKVLADFRNFAYTLPSVRGLTIHLKNRTTDVMLPRNRYDQVIKGLNNSNDHVLAYASNFSVVADSHLVCIQTNTGDESSYQTQAINIHNKPRTVTGASFIVINGALKSAMGLSAKSSIVEDGLMVEIMPEKMVSLKTALKNMQDFSIGCGRLGAPEPDETVHIKWVDDDVQFNLGVKSPIDGKLMDGIPSIRVHNGTDYKGASRFIRWTEVFIVKCDDRPNGVHDPVDINKLSENIAKATCAALVKLLDLLATAGLTKLAVRTTIHPDNVGYEAGSEGTKLPPIYMNSLDNELIQVLHKAAQNSQDTHTVLELIFYILDD